MATVPALLDVLNEEELAVFRAFSRAARALFVQFDRDLQRDAGLSRSYFEILWRLHAAPDHTLRMSELAAVTGSQPSALTHAITRLEAEHKVRRELCAEDRRGWNAVITTEGERALALAAPFYAASVRRHFLEPLSPTEQSQVRRIGETLLEALDEAVLADQSVATEPRKAEVSP